MYIEKLVLENKIALCVRSSSIFVNEASKYKSDINLIKNQQRFDAKSIMGLLSMGIIKGDILKIEADGEDEKIAVNALIRLIKNMEK